MQSIHLLVAAGTLALLGSGTASAAEPLASELTGKPFVLVHERYAGNNWDLFLCRADGSGARNLTGTPDVHELYPQVSPDGRRICFVSDSGSGRDTVRSVWVMDSDGKNRRKVADRARQPCWAPDSRTLLYLPQEFPKWNVADYYTKGLVYHDVESGTSRPHPNSGKLHHLYNPSFAPNGRWIAATVHAGMGFDHRNLLIEAEGDRIIDLGIGGCRPSLSPDGKRLAWGLDDHTLVVAELDVDAADPKLGERLMEVHDAQRKIYHVDWSPDGAYLGFSRGPSSSGDPTKPGTHEAACEMVGIYAGDWDLWAVPFRAGDKLDFARPDPERFAQLTRDGESNKEPDWGVAAP